MTPATKSASPETWKADEGVSCGPGDHTTVNTASNRALLSKPANNVAAITQFPEYVFRMFSERRHTAHASLVHPRRQKRRYHPSRANHFDPARPSLQLPMRPQVVHVIHTRIGNLRFIQPRYYLRGSKSRKHLSDYGVKFRSRFRPE
jgi:hypothetical protein